MKNKKENNKNYKIHSKKLTGYIMSVEEWLETVKKSEEETLMDKTRGYRKFLASIEMNKKI